MSDFAEQGCSFLLGIFLRNVTRANVYRELSTFQFTRELKTNDLIVSTNARNVAVPRSKQIGGNKNRIPEYSDVPRHRSLRARRKLLLKNTRGPTDVPRNSLRGRATYWHSKCDR